MNAAQQVLSVPVIKNVLVATDFSPCAGSAMPAAASIARQFQARIHLLHVLGRDPAALGNKPGATPLQECEQALQRLRVISGTEPFQDSVCHLIAQPGAVSDIALECVKNFGIDLVVLGTHGRSGIKHLLIGSVAEDILQRVSCGVVTVGPNVRDDAKSHSSFATILFATHFAQGSMHALSYAIAFARAFRSRLIASHVIENGETVFARSAREIIDGAKEHLAQLMPSDVEHEVSVRHGPAADWILQLARQRNVDLIVIGAHSGISEELPWATTHRIIREAECPVLTATTCGTRSVAIR